MGDVDGKIQKSLSPAQKKKLIAVWEAIVKKGGGTFECLDETCSNPVETESLPKVTPVNLPEETPVEYEGDDSGFAEPKFISDQRLGFKPESAKLNAHKANAVLSPVAEYMKSNPDFKLFLAGTTAGDVNAEHAIILSSRRANAVKSFLVSQGIDESRIITAGLGSSDPWHIYGVGLGDGPLPSQNRKVVLLDASTKTAKELMN